MSSPAEPATRTLASLLGLLLILGPVTAHAGSDRDTGADTLGAGFVTPAAGASAPMQIDLDRELDRDLGDGAQPFDLDAPLWQPGVLDVAAGLPGRWQRELDRRAAILRQGKPRDHQAALALLGLLPNLSGELPRDQLIAFVDGVRSDRKRHPLVRALADDARAALHEDAGELAEAWALYRDNGRVLSWQVIGPFDNANRGGHDQRYGPEREGFDPSQTFEGKLAGEPLRWRPTEAENNLGGGYLSFDEFLRPNEYVTAYATTWVMAAKAQRAVIHVGTGGAHKVWVGDALVGEGEAYRSPNPLQDAYAIELREGWNRVLIKVGCEQGAWGLYARISGEDGSPIPGLEIAGAPALAIDQLPVAAPSRDATEIDPDAAPGKPPLSLRRMFEEAATDSGRDKASPAAELALTEFHHWVGPFAREDFSARDQARVADAAAQSPRSALYLALAEDDSARRRRALEVGVERARAEVATGDLHSRDELAQMLIELAFANAALGLARRAEELLVEAARVAPDDALIELARIEQLASDGFDLAALEWVEALRGRYPDSTTVLREQANRLFAIGRTREGLALLEQLSGAHRGDVAVLEQRIDAHLQLGEIDRALTLGRELVAGSAGRPAAWRRLAGLEEAAGNAEGAVGALLVAVDLAPQDPDLHGALGFLLSRVGDPGGAIVAFERSLELNPQQPEIRDLLTTLGASRDDVFARYAVSLEDVVEAANDEPTPASWQGKDAAVLHRMIATRIGASGLGERLDHRIVRILDDRGIKTQARHDFGYEPDESYVEVRRARVYRADGRIEDVGLVSHYAVGAAGYRMYYDQRGVAVEFPGLRVGDVLEVAFVRRDVARRNKFDDYYGDMVPLEGVEPIRHLEYLLEAPADLKLHANLPLTREAAADGRTAIHRLVRDDIAGLRPEADMPGWTEVADYLHVSTYQTWDEVGRWYWGLVEGQLLVDDAIEAGVREALADLPKDADERRQIAAIYRHVIKSTRYVGLEFGIHGYKPYRTTDIYNRRFGDCKDKASLLKVMLAQIGVQAHLVLVRTRDLGRIDERPASLSAFNHAIVYVPKYDLYMDGTAEHAGAFELPAGDQGASVVVVEDGKGASFRTIPYAPAAENLTRYELAVTLAGDGGATVDHHMTLIGAGASSWRGGLEAKEQRQERLTQMLARTFPGTVVRKASFPGIEDILAPVEVEASLEIPGYATVLAGGSGSSLRWRVVGHEVQLLRSFAAQQKREHPLELGVPNQEDRVIRFTLPAGMTFTQVPAGATVEAPFGRFVLAVEHSGRTATVTTSLAFTRARIEAGEYAAFREFLAEIDAALAQSFEGGR